MADGVEAPGGKRTQALVLDVLIGDDGEVIFPDLNEDLLDVALALDPESELACRRPGTAVAGREESGLGGADASGAQQVSLEGVEPTDVVDVVREVGNGVDQRR